MNSEEISPRKPFGLSDEYMKDEIELFRSRLISVISELSEEQLAILAEIAERAVRQ